MFRKVAAVQERLNECDGSAKLLKSPRQGDLSKLGSDAENHTLTALRERHSSFRNSN